MKLSQICRILQRSYFMLQLFVVDFCFSTFVRIKHLKNLCQFLIKLHKLAPDKIKSHISYLSENRYDRLNLQDFLKCQFEKNTSRRLCLFFEFVTPSHPEHRCDSGKEWWKKIPPDPGSGLTERLSL